MKKKNLHGSFKLTRREMLLGALGSFGAGCFLPQNNLFGLAIIAAADTDKNSLSGANIFRDVRNYADLGEHRTASDVDLKTSEWIAKELKSAGFSAQFQSFKTAQFSPAEKSLIVGGKKFAAFPLWFPQATKSGGINAPLQAAGDKTKPFVALVKFPFDARASIFRTSGHKEIIEKAVAAGAIGIVAVTESASGEIIGLNAMLSTEPWAVPVLCVGGRDAGN